MAITVNIYNDFQEELNRGTHNLPVDLYKATLHIGEVFVETDSVFTDIVAEIADADYSPKALENFVISTAAKITKVSCDDIEFGTAVSIAAAQIIIRKDQGDPTQDPLCFHIDLGGTQTSVSGRWKYVVDPTNGLYRLANTTLI